MHHICALRCPARLLATFVLVVGSVFPVCASGPLSLIPLPAQVTHGEGAFVVGKDTAIRTVENDKAANQAAEYFSDLLKRTRDTTLQLTHAAKTKAPSIEFLTDPTAPAGNEAYVLDVTPKYIRVRARHTAGLFYGGITLWQLLTPADARGFYANVAAVHIEDAPRFSWRGFMLDSARHFQSVEQIKQLLDQMALHKLNVFHWHLTDDQGWRLEIKQYPKLTQVGGCRIPAGAAGRDAGGRPQPYCGFYTQDQVRDLVAYAAARHITIVPEIEMPGHAQSAIASYPEFGVTGTAPPVSPDWGVHPYLYNVDDGTFRFLENVLTEVMTLFPGQYIHIGGDEAIKDQWKASQAIQEQRRKLGLKDEAELQSWFIKRIERFLVAHDRKLIGWDEILEGGLPPGASVMSWRGVKGAVEAARDGHDVVLTPSNLTYFNRMQGDAADEPPSHDYPTPLKAVYDFEPVPAELNTAQTKHVLGAQANLWTEHVRTFDNVQHKIFPRLAALAEGVWTPKDRRGFGDFLNRLPAQLLRYADTDISYADSAFAVHLKLEPGADAEHVRVTLSNQTGFGQIWYAVEEDELRPGKAGTTRYVEPFEVRKPAGIVATAYADPQRTSPDSNDANPSSLVAISKPRTQTIDNAALRTRQAEELAACSEGLVLRLEDDAPFQDPRAVLQVNILDACWLWKNADLDGIGAIRATVANLPYNFQIGEAINTVKLRKPATPEGELEVHLDSCDGPSIATLPLTHASKNDATTTLEGPLRNTSGKHDLCFVFTSRKPNPLWALDWVQLLPAGVAP